MSNILLIGAGQLGSRHLQGLAKNKEYLNIFVIEPNKDNQRVALERFRQIPGYISHDLQMNDDMSALPDLPYDMVIIATNADIRATITEKLVSKFKINYIIFEKVAFQNDQQFEQILTLLEEKKISSWVNCPKRYYPFYQTLKLLLSETGPLTLKVDGIEWGLACNSIHHIDLLSYLSGEIYFEPAESKLDNLIYDSKRKGFIEFYGTISGISQSGNRFSLNCNRKTDENEQPFQVITIANDEQVIKVNEANGNVSFYKQGHLEPYKTETIKVLNQSDLTDTEINQIIQSGKSLLPSLAESYEIHKPLLRILKKQYETTLGFSIENLPIT